MQWLSNFNHVMGVEGIFIIKLRSLFLIFSKNLNEVINNKTLKTSFIFLRWARKKFLTFFVADEAIGLLQKRKRNCDASKKCKKTIIFIKNFLKKVTSNATNETDKSRDEFQFLIGERNQLLPNHFFAAPGCQAHKSEIEIERTWGHQYLEMK